MQFSDSFDRADGADLGAEWTPYTGRELKIFSNAVRATTLDNTADEFCTLQGPGPDQYAQVSLKTLTEATGEISVGVRATAAAGTRTKYFVVAHQTGTRLGKLIAGAFTEFTTDATVWASSDILRLTVNQRGNDALLTVYRNGIALFSYLDAPAAIASGTLSLSIYALTSLANVEADDFLGGDFIEVRSEAHPNLKVLLADIEDDGRFDDLDVRNWFCRMLPA